MVCVVTFFIFASTGLPRLQVDVGTAVVVGMYCSVRSSESVKITKCVHVPACFLKYSIENGLKTHRRLYVCVDYACVVIIKPYQVPSNSEHINTLFCTMFELLYKFHSSLARANFL